MQEMMKARAIELLQNGTVVRVVGWKAGDFVYDITPAVFETPEEIEKDFVYNDFCAANLSKYMIAVSRKEGKTLVFLKPCDTYSFLQLMKEHRIIRENVYIIGVESYGKVDPTKLEALGITGITGIESVGADFKVSTIYGDKTVRKWSIIAEKCANCKSKKHVVYDELLCEEGDIEETERFAEVERLEAMTPEERFAFWQNELSRCIRCNACRNVCPACSCETCVFDNPKSGVQNKGAANSFEENLFHIIRAFHVAGRCTDCGECSRVCPQNIPLHLLNRKFIKDINAFYGEYQAGADEETRAPLNTYKTDDCEPDIVYKRGDNA